MDNVGGKRVALEQPSEDISHDDEKIGRQRVTLTQASFAIDPPPGNTVHEHRGFPRAEQVLHPSTPRFGEATALKDRV